MALSLQLPSSMLKLPMIALALQKGSTFIGELTGSDMTCFLMVNQSSFDMTCFLMANQSSFGSKSLARVFGTSAGIDFQPCANCASLFS